MKAQAHPAVGVRNSSLGGGQKSTPEHAVAAAMCSRVSVIAGPCQRPVVAAGYGEDAFCSATGAGLRIQLCVSAFYTCDRCGRRGSHLVESHAQADVVLPDLQGRAKQLAMNPAE